MMIYHYMRPRESLNRLLTIKGSRVTDASGTRPNFDTIENVKKGKMM